MLIDVVVFDSVQENCSSNEFLNLKYMQHAKCIGNNLNKVYKLLKFDVFFNIVR